MRRAYQRHQAGFVLLIGLTVMSIVLTLAGAGLTRSLTELRVANRSLTGHQAFQLAEAGIDDVIDEFRTGGTFPFEDDNGHWHQGDGVTPCAPGNPCLKTIGMDDGEVRIIVSDIASASITVDVTGATLPTAPMGLVERRLHVVGTLQSQGFDFAFFGADFLQFGTGGPLTIDSYNSNEGPYDPANPGNRGHIGTNDSPDPNDPDGSDPATDIVFHPNAMIHGNLYAPPTATFDPADPTDPDGNPATNDARLDGAVVSGPRLNLPSLGVPPVLKEIDCSGAADLSLSSGIRVLDQPCYNTIFVTGTGEVRMLNDVSAKRVAVRNTAKVVMEPDARLYLRGDPSAANPNEFNIVEISNDGEIRTRGNNEIYGELGRFYVRGRGGFVNESAYPRELRIRLEGNNSIYGDGYYGNDHYLGQGPFYGVVYLRNGFLWVKGPWDWTTGQWMSGEHYGSIVSGAQLSPATHVASIYLKFHRDEAVAGIPLSGTLNTFRIILWQDCESDQCP